MTKNTSHSSPSERTSASRRRTATPERRRLSAMSVAADADRGEAYVEPTRDDIAHRAYFRFLERGGDPGREQEDWLEAERELRNGH